jgi:hypothetical protein
MGFGKRGVSEQPAVPSQLASGSVAPDKIGEDDDGGFDSKHLVIGAASLLALVFIGRPLMSFVLQFALQGVSFGGPTAGIGAFIELTRNADTILAGEQNSVELAIHKRCEAPILAPLKKISASPETLRNWPSYGMEDGVANLANYVACVIADTPSRFCAPATQERLITILNAYADGRANVRQRVKESMQIPPEVVAKMAKDMGVEDSAATQPANPEAGLAPILTTLDPRIGRGIQLLIANGTVAPAVFAKAQIGQDPAVKAIIEGTVTGQQACTGLASG